MDARGLGDRLAIQRARLANERTLLAYVRTRLALAAGGVAVLEFLDTHPTLSVIAWILVASGVVTLAVGARRFYAARKSLPSQGSPP
jgi:putative membrane protein